MIIGYTNKNSIVHRLNPSLKFIAFIVMVVMIFLPLGFFAQLIIGLFLFSIFIMSKLSWRKFWNITKSVIFLYLILLLVNWIIYKQPIAVFEKNDFFSISIGKNNWITGLGLEPLKNENGTSYVSNLWSGNIIGFINPEGIKINGQLIKINDIISENNISIESASHLFNSLNDKNKTILLELCNNDKNLAINYYWIINNGFIYNGQKYLIEILKNTNNGIINNQSAVVYKSYWYTLSPLAVQLALYISIKVLLMIIAATILTATTNSIELAYALEDILSPLKIFRFPVVEASMIIAIALRFIPSLLSESQRILNAQSSRGIDFKNGNIKDKFKSIISLVVPLFNVAFIKSSELANAMDARSYNTRYARTRYRKFRLTFWDWMFFAILCLTSGILIGIMFKQLLFTPFGIFEIGMLVK